MTTETSMASVGLMRAAWWPRRVEIVVSGAALLGLWLFLVLTGAAIEAATGTVVMLGVQAVAGFLIWRLLRPQASALESVGAALAIGTALAALVGSVAASLSAWLWLAPSAIAVFVTLAVHRRWRSTGVGQSVTLGEWWALGIGIAIGAATLAANLLRYPISWMGSWGGFHPDMIFFEALSESVAQLGPWNSIFTPGERILYHWLAYGWSGQITAITGAEPLVTLTRTLPYVTVVAGLMLVISWARTLSPVSWVPGLAALLFLLSGHVGVVYGSALNFDSPSQSMSALWIVAWAMALIFWLDHSGGRIPSIAYLVVLTALGACVMLAKSSAGAVLMGAALVLVLAGVLLRASWTARAFTGFLASAAGAATVFLVFIWGSQGAGGIEMGSLLDRASSLQGLNPITGREGILAGTALVLLGIGLRWASIPFLVIDPRLRLQPPTWLAVGLVAAGLGGVLLFNGGQNELWFAAASIAPLASLSAVATAIAWGYIGPAQNARRRAVLVLLSAAGLTVLVWALWLTGPSGGNLWQGTLRWAAPVAVVLGALGLGWIVVKATGGRSALAVLAAAAVLATATAATGRLLGIGTAQLGAQPPTRGEFFTIPEIAVDFLDREADREVSARLLEAGAIARSLPDPGLIATNMTFGAEVPAFTGMQTLASGTWYQAPYGPAGVTDVLSSRERLSWSFIDTPSRESLDRICDAGVSLVWIDPGRSVAASWDDWGTVLLDTEEVVLLDVSDRC